MERFINKKSVTSVDFLLLTRFSSWSQMHNSETKGTFKQLTFVRGNARIICQRSVTRLEEGRDKSQNKKNKTRPVKNKGFD